MSETTAIDAPPCPMCGHAAVTLRYHGTNAHGVTPCNGLFSEWITRGRGAHLHCICERCEYDWTIAVLTERQQATQIDA